MTRTPFDEFTKGLLQVLLNSSGSVEISREVPGEARWIDVYFSPQFGSDRDPTIGILGKIAQNPCLFEAYRNPVSTQEVKDCLLKLLAVHAKQSKGEVLSFLWILTPTASTQRLQEFSATADPDWLRGIYTLAPALHTKIVVIHQLPQTPETLWLRLLGRGGTQQQAIQE
jgi:hypothetical protein